MTVTDAPDPTVPFSALTYIVTVHNLGPMAAYGVDAGDTLPGQVQYLGASATQGACTGPPVGSTGTVDCALGTVAAGATATITISGFVTAPAGTMLTNTATTTSPLANDATPSDNTATATTRICAFVIGSSCVLGG